MTNGPGACRSQFQMSKGNPDNDGSPWWPARAFLRRSMKFFLIFAMVSTAAGAAKPPGNDGAEPLNKAAPKSDSLQAARPFVPTAQYHTRQVAGWTVHINQELLNERAELGRAALLLLETKLREIRTIVPRRALAALERVPIWLGVDDYAVPNATYHPSEEWLRTHGWNPEKARCVEIGNAAAFIDWSKDQPMIVLHELAHSYHHQVLRHDHAGLRAAYESAKASGRYERVERGNGRAARAYALNNDQEFFAEASEAYFGRNDFQPFTRDELKVFDPETFVVIEEVWNQ